MCQCICVSTIELAGVRLQTVKQILVPTRSSSVDGQDEPSREGGVPVAQLGQLHRQWGQPPTQYFTPLKITHDMIVSYSLMDWRTVLSNTIYLLYIYSLKERMTLCLRGHVTWLCVCDLVPAGRVCCRKTATGIGFAESGSSAYSRCTLLPTGLLSLLCQHIHKWCG